jgi:hypothetical protein
MKEIATIFLILKAIMRSNCNKITGFDDFDNSGNQPIDTGTVTITFDKYENDFWYVPLGSRDTCYFSFKNEGTADFEGYW